MGKKYDYRLIQPSTEKKHHAGHFEIFRTDGLDSPLAKCWCRESAELIVKALNANG